LIFSDLEAKNYHIFSSMKINYECKNNQLSDTLSKFFEKNVNLAHIKLISLFMMALCKAKTVCFSKLSTCFDSPAKAESCLRRIQWFFCETFHLPGPCRQIHFPNASEEGEIPVGH